MLQYFLNILVGQAQAVVWLWLRWFLDPARLAGLVNQIAKLIRHPLSARAVGWAMQQCPQGLPWHRVVNASGGISTENMTDPPGLQRLLLEGEGVSFDGAGKLSMTRYRFSPAKQTKKK